MKKHCVTTVALAALIAAPAMAADLPVSTAAAPPQPLDITYRWGGFYVGIHGGGNWFSKDWFAPITPNNIAAGCGPSAPQCGVPAGGHTSSSWLAGFQLGFNQQLGWLVWGVHVDQSWTSLESSNASAIPAGLAAGLVNHSRTSSVGTAGARIGAAWGQALFYVKAGGAWAFDQFWTTAPICDTFTCQRLRDTRLGGMVGAGVEYAFGRNWSVKVEYEHLDFIRQREPLDPICTGCLAFDYDIQQRMDLVRVGLNYSFNSNPVNSSRPLSDRWNWPM
jgi:outer membrane immunogenic protein